MGKWHEKFDNLVKSLPEMKRVLSSRRRWLIWIAVTVGLPVVIWSLYQFEGSGFGPDSNTSVTTEEAINPRDGKIIKLKKETKQFQSAKTLWDWLGLASTLAIPVILFQFERREQRQADKQAEAEKAIAENNLREQALEAYIDRMSELLLDKKLKTLTADDRNTAFEVARARTLSVLRRLDKDGERKGSVVRFLIDAELISELNLNDVSLEGAHLEGAHLEGAHLEGAHLEGAHLEGAYLKGAHLKGADLKGANLFRAHLTGADLGGAHLEGAHLTNAHLEGADLTSAHLEGAYLYNTHLEGAHLYGAYLEGAHLEHVFLKGAYLENATLNYANLFSAQLQDAYLKGADLIGTNLNYANLKDAHLEDAYLKGAELEKALLNEETILPDGSKYQSRDQLTKFTHPDATA